MTERRTFDLVTRILLAAAVLAGGLSGASASGEPAPGKARPSAAADGGKRQAVQQYLADAQAAFSAGNPGSAIALAQEGFGLAQTALGAADVDTNRLAETLARLLYRQGQAAKSEALFDRVLEWNKRVLGEDNLETLASATDLALVLSDEVKFEKAESLYHWIIREYSKKYGLESEVTLGAMGNISNLYRNSGRFEEAENLSNRVVSTAKRKFKDDDYLNITAKLNLGLLYQLEGRYAEAEVISMEVLTERERSLGLGDRDTILALNNLASLYESEGRYDQAAAVFRRAVDAADRAFGKNNGYSPVLSANLAAAYLNLGDVERAQRMLTELVRTREAEFGSDSELTLAAKNNLANALDQAGRHADAETLYRAVMQGRSQRLGPQHPLTLEASQNLALAIAEQGRFEEAQGQYATLVEGTSRTLGPQHPFTIAALSAATTNELKSPRLAGAAVADARLLVSAIRNRRARAAPSPVSEAQGAREQRKHSGDFVLLADAAWVAAGQGRKPTDRFNSEVFASLQDAVTGTAGSAIARASARSVAASRSKDLETLVRRRQDLSDQWTASEALFANAAGTPGEDGRSRRETLAADAQRRGAEMDHIDARLRVEFPDYFAFVRPAPLSIAATQKLLGPDEAILLVMPSEFGAHVVAVSRDSFKWVRSDWTQTKVAAVVRRLLWDVGADVGVDAATAAQWQAQGGPGSPFDRGDAYALHQQLIAPVAKVLAGKRHVFIVSGGVLSSLPFGVLVTEPPVGADGDPAALRATKWFADAHALIVIPSIQSLQALRGAAKRTGGDLAPTEFAGYGDPVLDGRAQGRGARLAAAGRTARSAFAPGVTRTGAGRVDVNQLRLLHRLPRTAIELEAMRQALGAPPSSLHLGVQATEGAFKTADLSHTRILALATHGLMAGELRGAAEPGLVFTPPVSPTDEDDGFLTASEVATLKLDADWVILSACNTAAGDGSEGAPGLSGLARAFFFAGARNLLVSHWPVRDDVASRITVDAIRRRQSDPRLSRAEAVQQAMRDIRNDASHDTAGDSWAHPNAWAAFSLIGDGAR